MQSTLEPLETATEIIIDLRKHGHRHAPAFPWEAAPLAPPPRPSYGVVAFVGVSVRSPNPGPRLVRFPGRLSMRGGALSRECECECDAAASIAECAEGEAALGDVGRSKRYCGIGRGSPGRTPAAAGIRPGRRQNRQSRGDHAGVVGSAFEAAGTETHRTQTHANVRARTAHMHMHTHMYMHVLVRARRHAHMHTDPFTHTYVHMHTCTRARFRSLGWLSTRGGPTWCSSKSIAAFQQ